MLRFFISFFICLQSATASNVDFFSSHAEGWHWYKNKPLVSKKRIKERLSSSKDPEQIIKMWQRKHEALRARAIVTQKPRDVARFIAMQNFLINKSERFSEVFQYVVATNPGLDFEIESPSNSIAHAAHLEKKERLNSIKISRFAKNNGLFFFFDPMDEGSLKMSSIVSRFAEKYGFELLAIAKNKHGIESFPGARVDEGQASRLGIKYFPALMGIDPSTMKTVPLAHGRLHTLDELEFKLINLLEVGFNG